MEIGFFSFGGMTLTMQYVIGFLMALLPALIWGYVFFRKAPANKKASIIAFIGGALSVVPLFIWQRYWSFSFTLGNITVDHINIYQFSRVFTNQPSWESFLVFICIAIVISLLIYLSAAVIIFIVDILLGKNIKLAWKNIINRSIEEPILFVVMGVIVAIAIALSTNIFSLFVSDEAAMKMLEASFWSSVMVGFLEEYSKHLIVRFSQEDMIISIDNAIEYSIMIGLGFAFLENIVYFVDKLWLSPCSALDIAENRCLFNPETGEYVQQVGILLIPFIFRSLLSTAAHLIFSSIFGYFYGIAHFASYQLQKEEEKKIGSIIWGWVHHCFKMNTKFVFHQVKILEGLFYAMFTHGLFNFFLDQEKAFITVPMIFIGYLIVSHLLSKKENHKKLRLLVEDKDALKSSLENIDGNILLLQKFEENIEKMEQKQQNPMTEIQKNIKLLEKYEKLMDRNKE